MKSTAAAVLIIVVMLVALAGFYPTYISKFPEFSGLKKVHHFHGAMMMTWFGMLIVQPLLITYKKLDWHRTLGKASYLIAPVVAVSIYMVMREEYFDDISKYSRERSLAGLDIDLLSIFSFVLLYSLAIGYRKKMDLHMRYMICTGLLIFIPGLGRLLVIGLGLSNGTTGLSILLITFGLYVGLMIYDRKKGNTIVPYVVGLSLVTLTNIVVATNKSAPWQWFAGTVADHTF